MAFDTIGAVPCASVHNGGYLRAQLPFQLDP
jgi:hypothetical protein